MSLAENGISLEHFLRYAMDVSAGHKQVEAARAGIPLSFILIGKSRLHADPGADESGREGIDGKSSRSCTRSE